MILVVVIKYRKYLLFLPIKMKLTPCPRISFYVNIYCFSPWKDFRSEVLGVSEVSFDCHSSICLLKRGGKGHCISISVCFRAECPHSACVRPQLQYLCLQRRGCRLELSSSTEGQLLPALCKQDCHSRMTALCGRCSVSTGLRHFIRKPSDPRIRQRVLI